MIRVVEGVLAAVGPDWAEVAVGGVTLQVFMPTSDADSVGMVGQRVRLYTHLQVGQDNIALFGFPTKEARSAFEALINVSGVGPRLALSVLSTMTPDALAVAVESGEPTAFKGIVGVGTKTAARIVIDLRGKLEAELAVATAPRVDIEVVEALTALGYTVAEARQAVGGLPLDGDVPLEERVRLALTSVGSG